MSDAKQAQVAVTVRPSELVALLKATIPAGLPVLITGAPGIGKTDLVRQAAQAVLADVVMMHPAISDPTDFKGLPWMQSGAQCADFVPFGELKVLLDAQRRTVCFADDLGQASGMVQAAYMQLLHSSTGQRRLGAHVLPECITHVAATNRRADRAGVQGLLEPVKSRFATIVELVSDLNDWIDWYFGHFGEASTEVPAFLRFKPTLLSDFQASADLVNSPSPRTWAHVGRILRLGLAQHLEYAALVGAVGEGAAGEFKAFQRVWKSLPDLDSILLDPVNAPIPSEPSALYAVAVGLAARATVKNFGQLVTYGNRLAEAYHGDIGVLLMQDAQRKAPQITYTKAYLDMSRGPLGKLITGLV